MPELLEILQTKANENKPVVPSEEPIVPLGEPIIPAAQKSDEPVVSKEPINKFDIKSFNELTKKYGREFKEEKEIDEFFTLPTKLTEYQKKEKELTESHSLTKKELDELRVKYDSEKDNFKYVNIDDYIAPKLRKSNAILLKHPDLDENVMIEISKMDLSKNEYTNEENIDFLVKKELLKNADVYKGMTDADIKEVVLSKYDTTMSDIESWDNVTKAKVRLAGKEARMEFAEYQKVEPNTPIDVEKLKQERVSKDRQQFEQIKTQWTPLVTKMLDDLKKEPLSIPDSKGQELIKWNADINDKFTNDILQGIDFLAYTGQPVNEQTVQGVIKNIKRSYLADDLPKIADAVYQKGKTEEYDKWHNENHNDTPLSDKTAPVKTGDAEVLAKVQEIKGLI